MQPAHTSINWEPVYSAMKAIVQWYAFRATYFLKTGFVYFTAKGAVLQNKYKRGKVCPPWETIWQVMWGTSEVFYLQNYYQSCTDVNDNVFSPFLTSWVVSIENVL